MAQAGADVLAFQVEARDEKGGGRSHVRQDVYKDTGVDTAEADAGLQSIVSRIKRTWPSSGDGRVELDIGYFANVINCGGMGIALCTDGVGSKTIIAEMMRKYDTIGIDCVAMNVNDLICVGAKPISMVDYIAIEEASSHVLDAIGQGLCQGAAEANISISGGEIAQLRDIVSGFDLVGMAVGHVDLDQILVGQDIREGDVVIGVRASGVHSNGLTLARRAFFQNNKYKVDSRLDDLDVTLGEELLRPTDIYVRDALEILDKIKGLKALVNITSDGLLNLTRVRANVGYVIDSMIEPHPIFPLIQHHARVEPEEMFEVFNMGTGFCYVVDPSDEESTLAILKSYGRVAQKIGYAVADDTRQVHVPQYGLVGQGKTFSKV